MQLGQTVVVNIAVEEFHTVNTRTSPCVDDINYNQAQCFDAKVIDYKIQRAGCHFPGITGYHSHVGDYPVCNNASSLQKLLLWKEKMIQELWHFYGRGRKK